MYFAYIISAGTSKAIGPKTRKVAHVIELKLKREIISKITEGRE
jgi:hypothetical protein